MSAKVSHAVLRLEGELRELGAYREAFFCLRAGQVPVKLSSGEGDRLVEVELLGAARHSGGVLLMGGSAVWAVDWVHRVKTTDADPHVREVARLIEREVERAAGLTYQEWISSDEASELARGLDRRGASDLVEASFREGRRECRVKTWKSVWTTAPEAYDQFGTETAEGPFVWHGNQLRRALVDPEFAEHQESRYFSGLHFVGDEDPRAVEARRAEQLAREAAERIEREQKRAAGLEWIRTADIEESEVLTEEVLDRELRARCLTWKDVGDEARRREVAREAEERAAKWARCRAAFQDGVTLVDDGAPGRTAFVGSASYQVPARAPALYQGVRVEGHYAEREDADLAVVRTVDGAHVFSLSYAAERIEAGELRVAGAEERFPPPAVLKRLGAGVAWKDVVRVPVEGGDVWAASPSFREVLVLDPRGHLARKRAVVAAAEAAFHESRRGR